MLSKEGTDGLASLLALMPALTIALSLFGCVWLRRRSSERARRRVEESHVQSAVTMSIEQQRRENRLPSANPVTTVPNYCVPRAATLLRGGDKLDNEVVIELAEISMEEDCEMRRTYTKDSYFKMKLAWLDRELRKLHRVDSKLVKLEVDRNDLFHDSFRAFARLSGDSLKSPLQVKFKKEEGRDDGGLTRHWFMLISREVVNPEYAMFISMGKDHAYHINSASKHQPHHLEYFRFIGRVWGKAAFDGFLVESHFTSSLYKYMLGIEIGVDDLQYVDGAYHNSLQWMLENDVESSKLDLTFSVDEDELGCITTVELKPGGTQLPVTNENKDEYVRLASMRRLVTGIQPQLEALRQGFYEVFPKELLLKFTESELELVLCGLPVIDVKDWMAHTEYKAGYTQHDDIINWFWELVEDWDQEMRARLLQFVTGTSKVPMGGFGSLYGATGPKKFQIIRVFDTTRLPQANTCFNELLLPPYHSKARLADFLVMSILDGGDMFNLR